MKQKCLSSVIALTAIMSGLVFPGVASATKVTVDGIKTAGEYTGTSSGTKSLLWWNDHNSIYTLAAANMNDLYWETNDEGIDGFTLNLFVEVPTYARRMLWIEECDYDGPGSDADCNAIPDAYLDAYLDGSHHSSVKMDYSTQTGSEFFQLNGLTGDGNKTKWQDEDVTVDNFTWATSREYLIDQGICTTSECLAFNTTASLELMWLGLESEDAALAISNSITDMELHLSDEARGLPPVPVPAAFWLFGSGLLGLVGIARRKKA